MFIYINLNIINYIIYSLTGYEILVKSYTLASTDPPIYRRSEATMEVVKDITENDFKYLQSTKVSLALGQQVGHCDYYQEEAQQ